MKKMIYYNHFLQTSEVLHRGSYLGYEYMCLNIGPYPTAYVAIPKGKPFYKVVLCEEVTIDCHGDCTFVNWGHPRGFDKSFKVIGWDYGHYYDFNGMQYNSLLGEHLHPKRKWSTPRIVSDCKKFIRSLHVTDNWKSVYI